MKNKNKAKAQSFKADHTHTYTFTSKHHTHTHTHIPPIREPQLSYLFFFREYYQLSKTQSLWSNWSSSPPKVFIFIFIFYSQEREKKMWVQRICREYWREWREKKRCWQWRRILIQSWNFRPLLPMVGMSRNPRALLLGHPRKILLFRILNWARSMALVPIPRFLFWKLFFLFNFLDFSSFLAFWVVLVCFVFAIDCLLLIECLCVNGIFVSVFLICDKSSKFIFFFVCLLMGSNGQWVFEQ